MNTFCLFTIFFMLTSCAVTRYEPRKAVGTTGYWSEKIQDGVHRVYVSYNSSSSANRAGNYLSIRGFELCAKGGNDYFDEGVRKDHKEYVDSTISANIFCYKDALRIGLGVTFERNSTKIEQFLKASHPQLELGDTIQKINGKAVQSIDDIKVALYNLRSSKKKMKIEILRSGKVKSVMVKGEIVPKLYSASDVRRWMRQAEVSSDLVDAIN